MQQALRDFEKSGDQLPIEVEAKWLIRGNICTDLPTLKADRKLPLLHLIRFIWQGFGCEKAHHTAHAMRCRNQSVLNAYEAMQTIIRNGFSAGCDEKLSWQERALSFGSALHTLQDSYCTAHTRRIDNGDPYSPIIDMYTFPSIHHPISTHRDSVWQDREKTSFKPEAAAAITATSAALRIFSEQSVQKIAGFIEQYLPFREDIAAQFHP